MPEDYKCRMLSIICPDLKTWLQERCSEFSRLFHTLRRLVTGPRLNRMFRSFRIISHPDLKTRLNFSNVSHFPDYFAFSKNSSVSQGFRKFQLAYFIGPDLDLGTLD